MELTEATEEFILFMSRDMLKGREKLPVFSEKERDGLKMYFDFVSGCFRKNIGVTLSVQEYLNFKSYYNRLVLNMLEQKKRLAGWRPSSTHHLSHPPLGLLASVKEVKPLNTCSHGIRNTTQIRS